MAVLIFTAATASTGHATPVLDRLQAHGFVCHSRGAAGDICTIARVNASGFSYPQPISIAIPKGVQSVRQISLFFHGWRHGICHGDTSGESMIDTFGFLDQVKRADPSNSTVTVVPTSRALLAGRGQTLPDFAALSTSGEFPKFVRWLDSVLAENGEAKFDVAGFSAGGKIMEQTLNNNRTFQNRVESASLLDATYSTPRFLNMWKSANHRMVIFASTATHGTRSGFLALEGVLGKSSNLTSSCVGMDESCKHVNHSHCATPAGDYGRFLRRSLARRRPPSDELILTTGLTSDSIR